MLAKQVKYTHQETARFEAYFEKPVKKRKRGRPKKRKRTKKKKASTQHLQHLPKVVPKRKSAKKSKARKRLFGKCEGIVNEDKQRDRCRINWDAEPHLSRREKLAQSWINKNDLYKVGDSFAFFCQREAIDRNVLKRYIKKKETGTKPKRRGRPTHLSESVMRHICESKFIAILFFCFIFLQIVHRVTPTTNSCGATRRTIWRSS